MSTNTARDIVDAIVFDIVDTKPVYSLLHYANDPRIDKETRDFVRHKLKATAKGLRELAAFVEKELRTERR